MAFVYIINSDAKCKSDLNCDFPFTFEGRTYNACTLDYKDASVPWCVTNQLLFDKSNKWNTSDGTPIGWEKCDKSCDIEQEGQCNTTDCEFPFKFDGHVFNKCSQTGYYTSYQGFVSQIKQNLTKGMHQIWIQMINQKVGKFALQNVLLSTQLVRNVNFHLHITIKHTMHAFRKIVKSMILKNKQMFHGVLQIKLYMIPMNPEAGIIAHGIVEMKTTRI